MRREREREKRKQYRAIEATDKMAKKTIASFDSSVI